MHLRWGWHRVERAMERGNVALEALFDHTCTWCVTNMPVEPVRLGREGRALGAIDTSTIARRRAGARLALAGKGFCHRAGHAVQANIVAAATSMVMIHGVRVGLVRRTRFGARCDYPPVLRDPPVNFVVRHGFHRSGKEVRQQQWSLAQ